MSGKFYDIHYHLFDLSHPNLLAFILRDDMITGESVRKIMRKLPLLLKFVPLGAVNFFSGKIAERIKDFIQNDAGKFRNLLSMMENPIEYHFLLADYYIRKEKIFSSRDEKLKFEKIVVCPLLIDFGFKNLKNSGCFYDLPPAKPVAHQVADVMKSIRFYYNYDIIPHPVKEGELRLVKSSAGKKEKQFEIYPFLGINTRNYDLLEIKALIDKYFSGYENDHIPIERYKKLFARLGEVEVNLEDLIFRKKEKENPEYYSYIFAGIKLYPPLGFNPWPEDEPAELDKVKFLLSECARKKIPVTVHCSDGGFKTTPKAKHFSNPEKWIKILNHSSLGDLRINFAHMGSRADGSREWLNTIVSLAEKFENVYTDFSCLTPEMKDYRLIADVMEKNMSSRLLFGSDFVINLLWSDSYNEYLKNFLTTPYLNTEQKIKLCSANPEKFLFG
ncbi:MAG: amidohydrolase family protein [Bacteroidales bacterium]